MKFEVDIYYQYNYKYSIYYEDIIKIVKIEDNIIYFSTILSRHSDIERSAFHMDSTMSKHLTEIPKETVELFKVLYE